MSDYKPFNPYELLTRISTQCENQLNDLFRLGINNREVLPLAKVITDSSALFQEKFNKYQEILGAQLNLPTKKDVANIAKLSIQTEEKIDSLEEQIWNLQDSLKSSNKEITDINKMTKKLTADTAKPKAKLDESKELRRELNELQKELSDIKSLKEDFSTLLEMMAENKNTADEKKREHVEKITKK